MYRSEIFDNGSAFFFPTATIPILVPVFFCKQCQMLFSLGLKWSQCETDRSHPYEVQIMNICIVASTPTTSPWRCVYAWGNFFPPFFFLECSVPYADDSLVREPSSLHIFVLELKEHKGMGR
jgi:hypothetical protein